MNHRLAHTASEGGTELRHVSEYAVHAIAAVGVRIRLDAKTGGKLAVEELFAE